MSVPGSWHLLLVGQVVAVYRNGVCQGGGVIVRLDRNGTYRVRDAVWGTYTTYTAGEVVPIVI